MDPFWELLKIVIAALLGAGLGVVTTALWKYRERVSKNAEEIKEELAQQSADLKKISDANDSGTIVLMRIQLVDFYRRYVINKEPMTVERKEEIETLWMAYHDGMHQNGTMTPVYEALHAVGVHIVGGADE